MGSVLKTLGATVADFVFPRLCPGCGERVFEEGMLVCPRCRDSMEALKLPLCPTCGAPDAPFSTEDICDCCPEGEIHFASARAVTEFAGVAKQLVERVKYNIHPEYAEWMGRRMAEVFKVEHQLVRDFHAIIPVPLHRTRERERGFNQSRLLAEEISRATGVELMNGVLLRHLFTKTQTRMGRRARAKNIAGAFKVAQVGCIRGKTILLVDDVHTTGATLNECARVLKEGGAECVCCMSFARAVLR